MTPQEAMARAIGTVLDYPTIDSKTPTFHEAAAAILDALPRGWVVFDLLSDDVFRDAAKYSAQQERKRLRAKAYHVVGDCPVCTATHDEQEAAWMTWRSMGRHLADPEDDR